MSSQPAFSFSLKSKYYCKSSIQYHNLEYVIPGATLALGLHLLFIALAFKENRAYLTLLVFCLAALLVPLLFPLQITIGSLSTTSQGGGWMLATAVIGILWLSLMVSLVLIHGTKLSRQMPENTRQPGRGRFTSSHL